MSNNQSSWPDSLQILRHQYGISVAEAQTFLLAKRPCGVKGLYLQASFWGKGTTGVSSEKPVRAKRERAAISTHILTAGFWTHATLLSPPCHSSSPKQGWGKILVGGYPASFGEEWGINGERGFKSTESEWSLLLSPVIKISPRLTQREF